MIEHGYFYRQERPDGTQIPLAEAKQFMFAFLATRTHGGRHLSPSEMEDMWCQVRDRACVVCDKRAGISPLCSHRRSEFGIFEYSHEFAKVVGAPYGRVCPYWLCAHCHRVFETRDEVARRILIAIVIREWQRHLRERGEMFSVIESHQLDATDELRVMLQVLGLSDKSQVHQVKIAKSEGKPQTK